MVSIEAGRDELLGRWIGEEVCRKLLDRKLVERQVLIVSVDDPCPPGPLSSLPVRLVTHGIGIAGCIEPEDRHAFAVAF